MAYKLLLADDSITIQKVVEMILLEQDYTIVSVTNGDEAFETAKKNRPDIILADIIMPGTDGYQLCKKVKEDPDLRKVPVLLLAGAYESFDTYKATTSGADDYIIKPFESQELIKKVKDCIEHGARPLPGEDEGADIKEEDLWASLDLTGKAEVTEAGILTGIEETEEAIGDVLGEEMVEEKAAETAELEKIMAEDEEESIPLEAEISEEVSEVMAPPVSDSTQRTEKTGVSVEPLSIEMLKEELSRTTEKVLRESILSSIVPDIIRDELGRKAEGLLSNALPEIIQSATQEIGRIIKETLSPSIDATLRETIEKVSWEVIPDIAERVTKSIIEASISSGIRETIEKVAWEVVPDMAEVIIAKEIERLKAD
jgi:DNA-binding response OmpR family regulator